MLPWSPFWQLLSPSQRLLSVFFLPLDLGADLVFHSATKYLNGHSDLTAGLLVTRETDERWEEMKFVRKHVGGVLGAFESWLVLRGMRTLAPDLSGLQAMRLGSLSILRATQM
jgi:O-acetylhomoserine/O-acetylserine sulfhydrylase-like pyridoxal-dependent enzyme